MLNKKFFLKKVYFILFIYLFYIFNGHPNNNKKNLCAFMIYKKKNVFLYIDLQILSQM